MSLKYIVYCVNSLTILLGDSAQTLDKTGISVIESIINLALSRQAQILKIKDAVKDKSSRSVA